MEKPDFILPESSVLKKIPAFLQQISDQKNSQMDCQIIDKDEIVTNEVPSLDYPEVIQFDVVAGLFEVRKTESKPDSQ